MLSFLLNEAYGKDQGLSCQSEPCLAESFFFFLNMAFCDCIVPRFCFSSLKITDYVINPNSVPSKLLYTIRHKGEGAAFSAPGAPDTASGPFTLHHRAGSPTFTDRCQEWGGRDST